MNKKYFFFTLINVYDSIQPSFFFIYNCNCLTRTGFNHLIEAIDVIKGKLSNSNDEYSLIILSKCFKF